MQNKAKNLEPEASELLDFITYRISQVHPKLNAQAAYILRKRAGLSQLQWRIIGLLNALGPAVPSVDLISHINMDKGLFSRTLKGLIADGFVTSIADSVDHRRLLLSLTTKGEEIYQKVIMTMRKRQEYLLHDVTETEKKVLYSALSKVENNAKRRDF